MRSYALACAARMKKMAKIKIKFYTKEASKKKAKSLKNHYFKFIKNEYFFYFLVGGTTDSLLPRVAHGTQ